MVSEPGARGRDPEASALFVAGATCTRRAGIDIERKLREAYDGRALLVPSSVFTGPPDLGQHASLDSELASHSGERLDVYAHSSGSEDFRRGWNIRKGWGMDMSQWNVVAIEPPQNPRNLAESMRVYLGAESRAIDALTAFPPRFLNEQEVLDLKTSTFPHLAQSGNGLAVAEYDSSIDYSNLLHPERRRELLNMDYELKVVLAKEQDKKVRELLIKRGKFLKPVLDAIYKGKHQPDARGRGEVRENRLWTPGEIGQAAGVLLGTAQGRPWDMLRKMRKREEKKGGPHVLFAVPEYGPVVSLADLEGFYGSEEAMAKGVIFMRGHTHASLAVQPGVLSNIKEVIDQRAA